MIFRQPVPELPVKCVVQAQVYYRGHLGFETVWHNEAGRIGAVVRGDAAIFFRAVERDIVCCIKWVFAEDVDGSLPISQRWVLKLSQHPRTHPGGCGNSRRSICMGTCITSI